MEPRKLSKMEREMMKSAIIRKAEKDQTFKAKMDKMVENKKKEEK